MKYTELIPGEWYIGRNDGNKWIFKFKELIDYKLYVFTSCNTSSGYITDGFFRDLNKIELASKAFVLQYFPKEIFKEKYYEIY